MGGCAYMLCLFLLGSETMSDEKREDRSQNCVELYVIAEEAELDPLLIISIAHTESRFDKKAVSRAGAIGMMQVLPKYFCPKKGKCDYTAAGIKAWKAWSRKKNKKRTTREALCRYNSGRPCKDAPRARVYANIVLKKHRKLLRKETTLCDYEPGC